MLAGGSPEQPGQSRRHARGILSDRRRKPLTNYAISSLARAALRSAELEGLTLMDLRMDYILRQIGAGGLEHAARVTGMNTATLKRLAEPYLQAGPGGAGAGGTGPEGPEPLLCPGGGCGITALIQRSGPVKRPQVAELLDLPDQSAGRVLRDLCADGLLEPMGLKYYLPGTVVTLEEQRTRILRLLEKERSASCAAFAVELGTNACQCGTLLHRMVRDSDIVRVGRKYELPDKLHNE